SETAAEETTDDFTEETTSEQESTTASETTLPDEENPENPKDEQQEDENYTVVNLDLTKAEEMGVTVYDMLQNELLKAKELGTPEKRYKIVLSEGTYPLDGTLNIYSNTYLEMEGTTLVRNSNQNASMLKAGVKKDVNQGYEGYGNITIHGGTFDGWDNESEPCLSNLIRFGHARNILIDDVVFTDNHNSHCIELGACKDVTIQNCTFENQHILYESEEKEKVSEAIQIDALQENSFPLYNEYDGTACRDVTVKNCTFDNVSRGVGSHAVIFGDTGYYYGINIIDNTFTNISEYPIISLCWVDSNITGNTISNSGKGILIRSIRSDFQRMYDGDFSEPIKDFNTVVSDNNISSKSGCIRLYGTELLEDYSWETEDGAKGTTPAGDYAISNITVKDNTLESDLNPINCLHTVNSLIVNNNIKITGGDTTSVGVTLKNDSHNNTVENNTIVSSGENAVKAGVLITGSCPQNTIKSNKISGPFLKGVFLYSGADSSAVTNNTISDSTEAGIYEYSCRNVLITDNTLKPKTGYGVYVKKDSTATDISSNKITVPASGTAVGVDGSKVNNIAKNTSTGGDVGIYGNNAELDKVETNTCKSNEFGVYLKNSTAKNVNSNDVKSPAGYGIRFNSVNCTNINSNSISKAGKYGIYMSSSSGKVNNNTITGSGTGGMYFDKTSQNTIYTNVFGSNKTADIIMEKSTSQIKATNISYPSAIKVQGVAYDKIMVSWSSVANATVYRIYRSTDNQNFTLVGSVSSKYTSFTDSSLDTDQKYYYKVRPIAAGEKTIVYGSYSAVSNSKITPATATVNSSKQTYSDRIKISWSSSFVPKEYNVYKRAKTESSYKLIKTLSGTTTSYTDTDILPDNTYYYKVRQVCYNTANKPLYGDYSKAFAVVPKVQTPSIQSLTPYGSNKAKISVKNKTGDTGYKVLYSTEKNKNFKVVKTLKSKNNIFECNVSLAKNKPAYFKVTAFYKKNGKTYSSAYSKVQALKVTVPTATIKTLKTVTALETVKGSKKAKVTKAELTWKKVQGEIKGYQIYCKINKGKFEEVKTTNNKTFKHLSVPLQKGYKYTYKVRAVKTFNGKTYYGDFSKVKTITVK
ncbi:MAG: right-handed parallel beta-helix repeat-containing protein, partial [Oscillospiraceae bacterium]|nr:right-handed parallel beta-helix repeat-containing protein [Oscillospiraceae bacterium]